MNNLVDLLGQHLVDTQAAVFLLDIAFKSYLLLALAAGVALLFFKASSAARHWVWFLALLALLILPLVSWAFPRGERHLWSLSTTRTSVNEMALTLEVGSIPDSGLRGSTLDVTAAPLGDGPPAARFEPWVPGQIEARVNAGWFGAVVGLWWIGTLALLTRMAVGRIALRKLRNSAVPLEDPAWSRQLDELRTALQIRRSVDLLQATSTNPPATWGTFRPVILLPDHSGAWSKDRRRAVLLHELSHVKRADCLTQTLAGIVTAIYWFNPLVWIAAHRMSVEREHACDDFVLNHGGKGSDYASHLLEIARASSAVRIVGAIAMARRPSQLAPRIVAILDPTRPRRLHRWFSAVSGSVACALLVGVAAQQPQTRPTAPLPADPTEMAPELDSRLRALFEDRKGVAQRTAATEEAARFPEIEQYFDAGVVGDWKTVARLRPERDELFNLGAVGQPILETWLAHELFSTWRPQHVLDFGNIILGSIPDGSIYFGGTDAGRGIVTALSQSPADAEGIFIITQNALADQTYLQYLHDRYDGRITLPDSNDHQRAMYEYFQDATRRFEASQLRPGEQVEITPEGVLRISGRVAVMQINALLAKVIFDRNPEREFYLEESFPLDWMYPHLVPHGPILRIERRPLTELPQEVLRQDHEYWQRLLGPRIGPWLEHSTPLEDVVAFTQRVLRDHDLRRFGGDPVFLADRPARQAFAKLRLAIAGVYGWRVQQTEPTAHHDAIRAAADLAFRQAFVLAPDLPEVIVRYATWLETEGRRADAAQILENGISFIEPVDPELIELLKRLGSSVP